MSGTPLEMWGSVLALSRGGPVAGMGTGVEPCAGAQRDIDWLDAWNGGHTD